jgi:two-component system nitrate/nitrite response regulator NarL
MASTKNKTYSVVVADDHPPVLQATLEVLRARDIDVLPATDGLEALDAIRSVKPNLALLDIRMPKLDGIEIARRVRNLQIPTHIVLYTGFGDVESMREAIEAGVKGFVSKDASLETLVKALDTVVAGGSYLDPILSGALYEEALGQEKPVLTPREREVIGGLSEGKTFSEIGRHLSIAPDTARVHMRKAAQKLGARNRVHLVAIALRRGLID